MQASCHLCLTSCLLGWTSLELGEGDFWKKQVFLLFETADHGTLPDRSHDRPKSSLLKARVVILLLALLPPCRILKLHLMVTAVTAAPTFPPQTSPATFVRMRYSRAPPLATFSIKKLSSMHSRNCLNCLTPACCVVSAANPGVAEIPHEDQGLGNSAFFQLSEDPSLQYHPRQCTCSS